MGAFGQNAEELPIAIGQAIADARNSVRCNWMSNAFRPSERWTSPVNELRGSAASPGLAYNDALPVSRINTEELDTLLRAQLRS